MKGVFITLSGLDGSGKTTLSKELVTELKRNGVNCKYVYGKLDPKITRFLIKFARIILLKGKNPYKDYREYSKKKREEIKKRRFLAKIYYSLLFLEYRISILLKIWIPLKFGKVVICDRYAIDTIASDIAPDLQYSYDRALLETRKMLKKLPKPDLTFLIDVPEEVAIKRKKDIPSIEYLCERRKLYLYLANELGVEVIDGTLKLEEIKCLVLKKIQKIMHPSN